MTKTRETVALIVQARMTSTRLPGKVLLPVMGRPLMAYQIERLSRLRSVDHFVIATTTNASDDPVATLAESMGWHVTRGPELDVLRRYRMAAQEVGADVIVRSTADCPLIDIEPVDMGIRRFLRDAADYLVYMGAADGMGFEVFSRAALDWMDENYHEPEAREHVTFGIYTHPDRWRIDGIEAPVDRSRERWTVDTPADFHLVARILETLYPVNPEFTTADIAALLDKHPDWRSINAEVEQKYGQITTELYQRVRGAA